MEEDFLNLLTTACFVGHPVYKVSNSNERMQFYTLVSLELEKIYIELQKHP